MRHLLICMARKPLGEPNPQASNLALAVALLVVLLLQAVFNAWQDFSTSRVMSSIKGMLPSDVVVLRDSVSTKVPAKDLVPGDLVMISMGEKIPADLRLIEASPDLQFDRSILTGEVYHFLIAATVIISNKISCKQSEPISGRVAMTDENFLEASHPYNSSLESSTDAFGRPKTLHCKVLTASVDPALDSSFRLGTTPSCKIPYFSFLYLPTSGIVLCSGIIAKLSSNESARLTTLQRELLRFVAIIAGMATVVAVIMVILWAAWYVLIVVPTFFVLISFQAA